MREWRFGSMRGGADGGHTITLWSLLPLYREEMDLKLRKGADALLDLFDAAGINEVINPARPKVTATRGPWWRFGRWPRRDPRRASRSRTDVQTHRPSHRLTGEGECVSASQA